MFQYLLTNIILVALAVVLYLVIRALPRLQEEEQNVRRPALIDRWLHSGIPQRVDMAIEAVTLKFVRKSKVVLLKADNALARHLQRKARAAPMPTIDLSEVHESSGLTQQKSGAEAAQ